ncbi:hypothetical protein [Lysobacter gummosus]|uniref:hypothetical protein n=1 Tax=Lysobacter gummosus TaxID=262324 RepID=UPI003627F824
MRCLCGYCEWDRCDGGYRRTTDRLDYRQAAPQAFADSRFPALTPEAICCAGRSRHPGEVEVCAH